MKHPHQQQQHRKLGNIISFLPRLWIPHWESSYAEGL
jgi:hypothetical protein